MEIYVGDFVEVKPNPGYLNKGRVLRLENGLCRMNPIDIYAGGMVYCRYGNSVMICPYRDCTVTVPITDVLRKLSDAEVQELI